MRLPPSYDSDHRSIWQINSGWLESIFLFFFNFIFQIFVDWKLNFIIYFNFFSFGLSWSHDPGCEVDKLTRVIFIIIFFQFHRSTLILLEIELYSLFFICFSYGYHNLIMRHANWQVNPGWPESTQYVIVSIFIKKYHIQYLFWVKPCFYGSSRLILDPLSRLAHIWSISH